MKKKELKPCPFCGYKRPILRKIFAKNDGWRDRYSVLCNYDEGGCGAEGGWRHYAEEAIMVWNRRAE